MPMAPLTVIRITPIQLQSGSMVRPRSTTQHWGQFGLTQTTREMVPGGIGSSDKDGYWNYNHMALQLEDLVNCLVPMFPDHDFVFLFDQSSGHGWKQKDGLNEKTMNFDWGGSSPAMHDTQLKESDLGPYHHPDRLNVGDVQWLVYNDTDRGPYAKKGIPLTDEQREVF